MRDPKKPTETGGGQGDRADRPAMKSQVAAYLVIESGISLLLHAGIDRFNLRRLLDVATAMAVEPPAPGAPAIALEAYRDTLTLGIMAAQSTDDIGAALNDRLWKDHIELQARLKAVDERI